MSLGLLAGLSGQAGFPRVSGDEHVSGVRVVSGLVFSPRERG